jgi:hypothetical protein
MNTNICVTSSDKMLVPYWLSAGQDLSRAEYQGNFTRVIRIRSSERSCHNNSDLLLAVMDKDKLNVKLSMCLISVGTL